MTSVGFGGGPQDRANLGHPGAGPQAVITDLGILEPCPETKELVMTHLHPGVSAQQAREATGWDLRVADAVETTLPPDETELTALRALSATA